MDENPQIPDQEIAQIKHHDIRKIVMLVLVLAVIVIVGWIFKYKLNNNQQSIVSDSELAARQALLDQVNSPANLSPQEIAARQKLLDAPNPPVRLTPEQIKTRQSFMGEI